MATLCQLGGTNILTLTILHSQARWQKSIFHWSKLASWQGFQLLFLLVSTSLIQVGTLSPYYLRNREPKGSLYYRNRDWVIVDFDHQYSLTTQNLKNYEKQKNPST